MPATANAPGWASLATMAAPPTWPPYGWNLAPRPTYSQFMPAMWPIGGTGGINRGGVSSSGGIGSINGGGTAGINGGVNGGINGGVTGGINSVVNAPAFALAGRAVPTVALSGGVPGCMVVYPFRMPATAGIATAATTTSVPAPPNHPQHMTQLPFQMVQMTGGGNLWGHAHQSLPAFRADSNSRPGSGVFLSNAPLTSAAALAHRPPTPAAQHHHQQSSHPQAQQPQHPHVAPVMASGGHGAGAASATDGHVVAAASATDGHALMVAPATSGHGVAAASGGYALTMAPVTNGHNVAPATNGHGVAAASGPDGRVLITASASAGHSSAVVSGPPSAAAAAAKPSSRKRTGSESGDSQPPPRKRGRRPKPKDNRVCLACAAVATPMWRMDRRGRLFCNACGTRLKKYGVCCTDCRNVPHNAARTRGRCDRCTAVLPPPDFTVFKSRDSASASALSATCKSASAPNTH